MVGCRSVFITGTVSRPLANIHRVSPHLPKNFLRKSKLKFARSPIVCTPMLVSFLPWLSLHRANVKQGAAIPSFKIISGNDSSGIGFFHVTSKLCKNLIVGHSDTGSNTQFIFYPLSYFISNILTVSKKFTGTGNIKPAFIYPEGFYKIRITIVNSSCLAAKINIGLIIRGQDD